MYKECHPDIDIYAMKQLTWNSVLIYIKKCIFILNGKSVLNYNDYELLENVADIYMELCYRYNKSISLYGYSLFTGIAYTTLLDWENNVHRHNIYIDMHNNTLIPNSELSVYKMHNPEADIIEIPNNKYSTIVKKLRIAREHTLTDKAEDGSVMSLALGKIEYGWIEGRDNQIKADLL